MRANLAALCFLFSMGAAVCSAQTDQNVAGPAAQPDASFVYCAGMIADPKIPDDVRVISGEQSIYKIVFARGDYVYISQGADKGVKVGDKFAILRPEKDPSLVEWFKGQNKVLRSLGTQYVDVGQVTVVNVQPKTSIAEVTFSCNYMQRGDIARPYEERPAPPYRPASAFEHFAPVSGKPVGTVVAAYDNTQTFGRGNIAYINLGAAKGLKVGDYVRVFRYQGSTGQFTEDQQPKSTQYYVYGFGGTPTRYAGKDLPREVLGEGIILNVSKNSSTVVITQSTSDLYTGDYVEIE